MYADSKYHNFALYEWVGANARYELTIVRRPAGSEGWVKLPIRWTVERTFAWLGRCRRLSKDREKSVLSSESFIKLAMIQLMLHPGETDAEFHIPRGGLPPLMGQSLKKDTPHSMPPLAVAGAHRSHVAHGATHSPPISGRATLHQARSRRLIVYHRTDV